LSEESWIKIRETSQRRLGSFVPLGTPSEEPEMAPRRISPEDPTVLLARPPVTLKDSSSVRPNEQVSDTGGFESI